MLTTRKNYNLKHGYKKQTLSDEFLARSFFKVSYIFIADTIRDASLSLSTP